MTEETGLPAAASGPRQHYLAAVYAQPGDVILVYSGGAGSWVTRLGQSVIRWLFTGVFRPARFSHVALVVGPEVALHAAPGTVRAQPIEEIMPARPDANVRVMRMASPPLEASDQDRLGMAAKFYFSQRYAFYYGQHSLGFSRLARAVGYTEQRLTQPFCSHLVAEAYLRIGRPIGTLAPDQTLPLDLEKACVEPAWRNVTHDYYRAGFRDAVLAPMRTVDPALQEPMATLQAGRSDAERVVARTLAAIPGVEHQVALGATSIVGFAVSAATISLNLALRGAKAPTIYLQTAGVVLMKDLAELDAHYALIEGAPKALAGTTAAQLKVLFPDLADGQAPYEGMQTLAELCEEDRKATMLYFAARTARLHTLFLASAIAIGIFESDNDIWRDFPLDLASPYLLAMPLLSAGRARRLKAAVPRVVQQFDEAPLGDLVVSVIDLHLALSNLRRGAQARRRARARRAARRGAA